MFTHYLPSNGNFFPMICHDLSGFEGISIHAPTFSNTLMILEAHNCHLPTSTYPPGNLYYQLLSRLLLGLLHDLDSPPSKFQFMLSRTPDLHTLRTAEFIFACRLPMSTLPNLYLYCRKLRQLMFSSAYPLTNFPT